MEKKKQLNFSAPLLSVRRNSSPRATTAGVNRKAREKSPPTRQHSLPPQKSESESEQVTKPAAVPFLWEKTPGKPKGECMTKSGEQPSVTPRLPPGRLRDACQKSGEVFTPRLPPGRLTDVRHRSGEVFSPRLSSGRLTDVRHRSGEVSNPRFPHGRLSNPRYRSGELFSEQNANGSQAEFLAVHDHATLLESLRDSLDAEGESDKESGEDAFSDALNTLSPTESLSLNCSLSGLSGSYGRNCKPSGNFCVDERTKDLMMRRFLPAAQAVVLETPQYVTRKQNVVAEQPKLDQRVIPQERKPLDKQSASSVSSFYNQYTEEVECDDGGGDYDDDPAKIIGKGCGLFPRLCVKSSLSLLKPVPGTKLRTQPSTPSATKLRTQPATPSATKLRTQPSTPSVGEVKRLTRNTYSGPLDKCAYDAIYKKRYHSGVLSQELHKVGNKLMNDPKRNSFSSDSYKGDGLSPLRRPRSGCISPYRNERPPSPFREGARFLGLPKEVELKADKIVPAIKRDNKFQDLSFQRKPGSESFGYAVEKTLYVDSMNIKVTPNTNVEFSKSERAVIPSSGKPKTMTESTRVAEYIAAMSGQDIEGLYVLEIGSKATSKCGSLTSGLTGSADKLENLSPNQNLELREMNAALLQSPLPPPLPKSPSESWLWRTLPSIPSQNPLSYSHGNHLLSEKQNQKQSNTDTKWETMVKSSNKHYDHIRYSEELISHIPRQRK